MKWPGGKTKELPIIEKFAPKKCDRYIEPFFGGGAVYFGFDFVNIPAFVNDKSRDLMQFYECVKERNADFFDTLNYLYFEFKCFEDFVGKHHDEIEDIFEGKLDVRIFIENNLNFLGSIANKNNIFFISETLRSIGLKVARIKALKIQNGGKLRNSYSEIMECALKQAYYFYVRKLYNYGEEYGLSKGEKSAVYFFIREYGYGCMFRFNKRGEYNEPYGGISYNRKDFQAKIDHLSSESVQYKMANVTLSCEDFESFLDSLDLTRDDWIFLDPPYDTAFSTYDQNIFGEDEQIRLRDYMKRTPARFLAIMKNTELIRDLYKGFDIISFDKQYQANVKNNFDRHTTHLVIKNY